VPGGLLREASARIRIRSLLIALQYMDDRRHPIPDHVEAALEASCGALRALEFSRAEMAAVGRELLTARDDTAHAIDLLRHAIGELRALANADRPESAALGFVLAGESGASGWSGERGVRSR
jgi:hypothetical protein